LPPGPVEDNRSTDGEGEVYEIERIVDHKPKQGKIERYLVRWVGYGPKDDQWKTVKELKHAKELIKEYMERMKVTKQLRGKKA
jgi:hypothetical protein